MDMNTLDQREFESPIKKMLKVDESYELTPMISDEKENAFANHNLQHKLVKTGKQHVEDLSMEEGAILLDKWTNNNFCDFEFWLQNADAQATFNIDEKVSFNSKPNKAKTIQIKNYQCHLELQFSDTNIDSLIANGFGKSKREARKTAIKQMVTF